MHDLIAGQKYSQILFFEFSGSKQSIKRNYEVFEYRIYPRIGRTFFKAKTFKIWGAAYTRVQEF